MDRTPGFLKFHSRAGTPKFMDTDTCSCTSKSSSSIPFEHRGRVSRVRAEEAELRGQVVARQEAA